MGRAILNARDPGATPTRRAATEGPDEEGTVAALTHEGEGIVRGGKTVFVQGALPGERIRFRRTKRHRQHDDARLVEVLEPAPDRVQPRCAHFGVCGGCALQHLAPESQLAAKQLELRDSLERVAHALPDEWLEPLRGPVWNYRRRARLGAKYVTRKGRVVVGFRERLSPYVAALERCEVLAAPADALITPLSEMLTSLSIRERVPQIEVAVADNAVALVLRVMQPPSENDLATLRAFERAHGVRLYLQTGGLDTVRRLESEAGTAAEEPPLVYRLPRFDLELEFAPTDFVQINGVVNEALVSRAVELLAPEPGAAVLDLFCGLGNFTLALARRAGRVVGVEGDRELVARAAVNARRNGLANATFHVADLARLAEQPGGAVAPWLDSAFPYVLLDPPRAGAREMLPTVARLRPKRVLYISCHPGSLARDIGMLVSEHGFRLRAAGVLDMFPHTTHVESIAVLEPSQAPA
ncbi:MAG: 23S rRNA (uracil(1939)-C(5))-methyltransferase RlmD [Steroidobacteraceae bacterium]|nr:23S rRNA (uracil(1939)-C(5))-methyltransferase RlmD [Steroidobacteraceae bacterium]